MFSFLKEVCGGLASYFFQYYFQVSGDAEKARKIVVEALEHIQPSKPLMEALIHFETIQPPPRKIDYLEPLVEKVIKPNADTHNIASSTEREELSLIYIEVTETKENDLYSLNFRLLTSCIYIVGYNSQMYISFAVPGSLWRCEVH